MVFSSLIFLYVYLPLTVLLYYVVPRRFRNPVLLVASLLFYGWGEPKWITIMVFSSLLDFFCSNYIEGHRDNDKACKRAVAVSCVGNLGVLAFFKYSGFIVANLPFLSALHIPEVSLPIGISFYTFQTMSCTIDVYRGEARAQKSLVDFATYVTLFPQLIAGPIVRYQQLADQLTRRRETLERFSDGITRFSVGLAKKVLLANQFGALWDQVQARSDAPALTALFGLICFTFQIYFDFSGYSDMAIGLGRLFGFELPENFRYPYISRSITEFWRRWHITLGVWFREYVYIPLGGNRGGTAKMLRNIFVVWFLTGLWHGASWNFALWGLYYGVLLLIEKVFLRGRMEKWPKACQHLYVMVLVVFGWALFAFVESAQLAQFLRCLTGGYGLWDNWLLYHLRTCWPLLVAGTIGATPLPARWWHRLADGRRRETDAATAATTPADATVAFTAQASSDTDAATTDTVATAAPTLSGEATAPTNTAASTTPAVAALYLTPILCAAALIICTAYLVNAGYNPFLYFRF